MDISKDAAAASACLQTRQGETPTWCANCSLGGDRYESHNRQIALACQGVYSVNNATVQESVPELITYG